jgi:hypothetical protein
MSHIRLGIFCSWIAAIAAAGYTIAQLLQISGVLVKPFDEILIYGFSLCIAPPFILAILALHYTVSANKKIWTHAALLFGLMYNTFVILMYVEQLAAVIPYHLNDPVLTVTPHSLFWNLDALGYINMGVATLFLVPAFSRHGKEKYVKWFFLAHGLITPVVGLVYFSPNFSIPLLLMASPWSITASGSMICLAYFFKRNLIKQMS